MPWQCGDPIQAQVERIIILIKTIPKFLYNHIKTKVLKNILWKVVYDMLLNHIKKYTKKKFTSKNTESTNEEPSMT